MSFARPANLDRDMLNAGNDIIPERKDRATRQKRGECPTCGNQLFKVGKLLGKKTPLTVEGKVYKGRCLNCKPLEGYMRKPAPQPTPVSPNPSQQQQQQQQNDQEPQTKSKKQSKSKKKKEEKSQKKPQKSPPQSPKVQQQQRQQQQQQQQHDIHQMPPPGPPMEYQLSQNHHQLMQQQQPLQPQLDISPHDIQFHHQMQQQQQQQFHMQQDLQHQQQQQSFPLDPHQMAAYPGPPQPMFPNTAHHAIPIHPQQAMMMRAAAAGAGPGGGGGGPKMTSTGHPNWEGTTLEVTHDQGDDVSVMSALTMDVRLMNNDDYHNHGPVRRPGPDGDDGQRHHHQNQNQNNRRGSNTLTAAVTAVGRAMLPNYSNNRGSSRRFRDTTMMMSPTVPENEEGIVVPTATTDHHVPTAIGADGANFGRVSNEMGGDGGGVAVPGHEGGTGPMGPYNTYHTGGQVHRTSSNNNPNNSSVLDADGYPIASNTFGWDRQRDLLPPGGDMDALLSPSPRVKPPPGGTSNKNAGLKNAITEEIQFLPPPGVADATDNYNNNNADNIVGHKDDRRKPAPPVVNVDEMRVAGYTEQYQSPPPDVPEMDDVLPPPRQPKKFASIMSGPSYQDDDEDDANNDVGHNERPANPPPHLKTSVSSSSHAPNLTSTVSRSSEVPPPSMSGPQLQTRPSVQTNLSDISPPLKSSRGRPDSARGLLDSTPGAPAMAAMADAGHEHAMAGDMIPEVDEQGPELMSHDEDQHFNAGAGAGTTGDSADLSSPDRKERRKSKKKDRKQEREARKAAVDAVRDLSKSIEETPDFLKKTSSSVDADVEQEQFQRKSPPATASSSTNATESTPTKKKKKKDVKSVNSDQKQKRKQRENLEQIPAIIYALGNYGTSNPHLRQKALHDLADILTDCGPKGREYIAENNCIEVLTKTMWNDMSDKDMQGAALQCILSMAASIDGEANNDLLANEDSICDAVLFSMQMHAKIPQIQLLGCCLFACLASASSNNKAISDGSLSGAVTMVLNAMSNHVRMRDIQKAGVQALYNQCYLSAHAEANKRSLIDCKVESGSSGVDVILQCIKRCQEDILTLEWAFQICWTLTSSEDLWKAVVGMELHTVLIPICEKHIANPTAVRLVEAAVGIIGNLAKAELNHMGLSNACAITLIVDALRHHPNHGGIKREAMLAIANLSTSPNLRNELVRLGSDRMALQTLEESATDVEFATNTLGALVGMAADPNAKKYIASSSTVVTLDRLSAQHHSSEILELCCALIASVTVSFDLMPIMIDSGAIQVLLRAIDKSSDEKVHSAAVSAFRNISCQSSFIDPLVDSGAGTAVVNIMEIFPESQPIQTNACCFLWNIAQQGRSLARGEVGFIVKAMQAHLESAALLEMACGALWNIIELSADGKQQVIQSEAIEVLAAAMMMHPTTTATLSKACGVLSTITTDGSVAKGIADAHGVNIVAETMRNNSGATDLLELGCLTLRNIVYAFPDCSEEAGIAIATVINAMQGKTRSVTFQREACNLIWILSAQSPSCQSKVLAHDGLSVLMNSMEQYSDDSEVQEAALAAFNQLASSTQDD